MRCDQELVIVADRDHAIHGGFDGEKHSALTSVRAWWPTLGISRLEGCRFKHITIDSRVQLSREMRNYLAATQVMFPDAVWMEL